MDQLQQFTQKARVCSYFMLVFSNFLLIATWFCSSIVFDLPLSTCVFVSILVAILTPLLLTYALSWIYLNPLRYVWGAILYAAPNTEQSEKPNTHNMHFGKSFTDHIISYVYSFGQTAKNAVQDSTTQNNTLSSNFVANSLPLPLIILDKDENIVFINKEATAYVCKEAADIVGKSLYSSFDFAFINDSTLDKWLLDAKQNTITAKASWEHVKLTVHDENPKNLLLDMAAFYNKSNTNGYETMLVLFDHNETYSKDDQAVNFVSLAVHELRTPLTMLRGYLEIIEEDLSGKLSPDLEDIMRKIKASSQQLTTFVNNILNVSRIESDQMMLNLHPEDWGKTLHNILQDLSLRANVRGIKIKENIQPDMPSVALDYVSIYEVISNLIDNSIKYSGSSKEIIISTKTTNDGLVETTVQDFGVGIPESALPHLFDKFYRDHHNKQQVGGTGIGLFLCKTFIEAHGGNIWVRSKEGEGAIFGFTILPYDRLAEEQKNKDNKNITRSAHGWVKNHSLYRR